MSPRTGRPTDDPKRTQTTIRLSDADLEKLEYCHQKTGLPKQQILRQGLYLIYESLKTKDESNKKG